MMRSLLPTDATFAIKDENVDVPAVPHGQDSISSQTYRLEINSTGKTHHNFLQVMRVMDSSQNNMPSVSLVQGSLGVMEGAEFSGTVVMFAKDSNPVTRESFNVAASSTKIIFVDLEPGQNYSVTKSGSSIVIEKSSSGFISSAEGSLMVSF